MPDGSADYRSEKNMTITGPDGTKSPPFSIEDMERVGREVKGARMTLKETEADRKVVEKVYRATASNLRSFIERFERLAQEKQEIADQQKEVMSEAKGRGYDTKVLRRVIAMRKRDPDDLAEEEAVLAIYREALGI